MCARRRTAGGSTTLSSRGFARRHLPRRCGRSLIPENSWRRRETRQPFFVSPISNLKDFVRQVSAGANCDRYVMVHRHGGKRVFGIGIAKFEASLVNRTYLYALMYVRVYDGRTFELIKDGPARIDDEPFLSRAFVNPIGGPYLVADDRSFPASREEAVANPTLREGVRALLTASLDKTLPVMLRQSARQPPQ